MEGLAKAKEMKPDFSAKMMIIARPLDPHIAKMLHQLVLYMNLYSDAVFRDYLKRITEIFCTLDAFVSFSKNEGFS